MSSQTTRVLFHSCKRFLATLLDITVAFAGQVSEECFVTTVGMGWSGPLGAGGREGWGAALAGLPAFSEWGPEQELRAAFASGLCDVQRNRDTCMDPFVELHSPSSDQKPLCSMQLVPGWPGQFLLCCIRGVTLKWCKNCSNSGLAGNRYRTLLPRLTHRAPGWIQKALAVSLVLGIPSFILITRPGHVNRKC
jgi:hypothetical protein